MVSLQNFKTFFFGKEDRKGQEDYNDYPDFNQMQGCTCGVNLFLRALAHLNRDNGLQHWAINSYTTTGHTAAVSSAHKDGCLRNDTSVMPVAKTRAQSAPATCALLHTKHTSLSHQR